MKNDEWISVETKLPKKNIRVLVYNRQFKKENWNYEVAYLGGIRGEKIWYNENVEEIEPTHWMSFPKVPVFETF